MPKMKTHKGAAKRFKVTAKGKLRYKHPAGNHLMSSKNSKQRRKIATPGVITGVYAKRNRLVIGA